jgi:hypothetical protein
MHPWKVVTFFNDRGFSECQLFETLTHLFLRCERSRKPYIRRMVPGLRLKETTVKIPKLGVLHMLAKERKTLAASGLDEAGHEQPVDGSARLLSPNQLVKSRPVGARREFAKRNPSAVEQVEHHPKVLKLLFHDLGHRPREIGVVHVRKKKVHGGACRLLLAVRMVNEHEIEVSIHLNKPAGTGRRLKTQHL